MLDSFQCFRGISTWGCLDFDWKVSMVLQNSKLSRGALERAWKFDSATITQIFVFHGIYPSLKLGHACKYKTVLSSVVQEIMTMTGDRTNEWNDDAAINPATPGITWPSMGVYHVDFQEEELAQICCHNPFEESVPIKQHSN